MNNSKTIVMYLFSYAIFSVVGFKLGVVYGQKHLPENNSVENVKVNLENENDEVYAVAKGENIYGRDVLPKIKDDLIQMEKNKTELKKIAVIDFLKVKFKFDQLNPEEWKEQAVTKAEIAKFAKERAIVIEQLSKAEMENIINNIKMGKVIEKKRLAEQKIIDDMKIEWKIR